jgi:hypothetical protein
MLTCVIAYRKTIAVVDTSADQKKTVHPKHSTLTECGRRTKLKRKCERLPKTKNALTIRARKLALWQVKKKIKTIAWYTYLIACFRWSLPSVSHALRRPFVRGLSVFRFQRIVTWIRANIAIALSKQTHTYICVNKLPSSRVQTKTILRLNFKRPLFWSGLTGGRVWEHFQEGWAKSVHLTLMVLTIVDFYFLSTIITQNVVPMVETVSIVITKLDTAFGRNAL